MTVKKNCWIDDPGGHNIEFCQPMGVLKIETCQV